MQRLSFRYSSGTELAAFTAALGYQNARAVQLTSGQLEGHLQATAFSETHGCIGLEQNQSLLYTADKSADSHEICVVQRVAGDTEDYVDYGKSYSNGTITALLWEKNETACVLGKRGRMLLSSSSNETIKQVAASVDALCGGAGSRALELMERFNLFAPTAEFYGKLENALYQRIYAPEPDVHGTSEQNLLTLLFQALTTDCSPLRGVNQNRIEILRDVVKAQFATSDFQPISITALAKELHTSRRTLENAVNDYMFIGPHDLVRSARLEQARELNTSAAAREVFTEKTGLKPNLGNIYQHFELPKGSKGTQLYKAHFGIHPKEDRQLTAA